MLDVQPHLTIACGQCLGRLAAPNLATELDGLLLAVRAAVGQLLEYRKFIGPKESALCILLDGDPGKALVEYVENDLQILIVWLTPEGFFGGPQSAMRLPELNLMLT